MIPKGRHSRLRMPFLILGRVLVYEDRHEVGVLACRRGGVLVVRVRGKRSTATRADSVGQFVVLGEFRVFGLQ